MKDIKIFINEYQTKYNPETLAYRAGEICEDGDITNQQFGAEETFAIGMPVYDKEGNELGRLSIGLLENLNYSMPEDVNLKIPVFAWRVDGYKGKRQSIKTFYQQKSDALPLAL